MTGAFTRLFRSRRPLLTAFSSYRQIVHAPRSSGRTSSGPTAPTWRGKRRRPPNELALRGSTSTRVGFSRRRSARLTLLRLPPTRPTLRQTLPTINPSTSSTPAILPGRLAINSRCLLILNLKHNLKEETLTLTLPHTRRHTVLRTLSRTRRTSLHPATDIHRQATATALLLQRTGVRIPTPT